MKILYTFLLLILSTAVQAQADRLVSIQMSKIKNSAYVPIDSYAIVYKPGNMTTGSAQDYFEGKIKFDQRLYFQYDANAGYELSKKYTYDRDAAGRITQTLVERAHTGTSMVNDELFLYSYTAGGFEDTGYNLSWKYSQSTWDTMQRRFYTYDAAGNMLTSEIWWSQPLYYNVYTYDGNRLSTVLKYQWQISNSTYDSISRTYYTYNSQGLPDTVLTKRYVAASPTWQDADIVFFAYNSNNQETLETNIIRTQVNGPWKNHYQKQIHYNAQNEVIAWDNLSWSDPQNQWWNTIRDSFITVSTSPKIVQEMRKDGNPVVGLKNRWSVTKITDAAGRWSVFIDSTWNETLQQWELAYNDEKTTFGYGQGLGIAPGSQKPIELDIYPNPTTSYINIQLSATDTQPLIAAIYNSMGQLVGQQHLPAGSRQHTIPVAHLGTGNYVLTVQTKDGKVSRQFAIVK